MPPVAHRFQSVAARVASGAVCLVTIILILGIGGHQNPRSPFLSLPGTQVGTVDSANSVQTCMQCHNSLSPARPVTIYPKWAGSMMAHSARDPVFFAALAVTNKYRTGEGEYCIRCHSPTGWLAGHSEDYTGQALAGTDFDGVQCDYCHRSVDPLNPDSTVPYFPRPVPGYGNGMHAVERLTTPKRGPFDSVAAPHRTQFDPFQKSSELCGVCHDVSNPVYAQDRFTQAPHEYGPLERTYSEWLMSWYATQGDSGTCQSCHMKDTAGYACAYPTAPMRPHIAQHDLTGGNTFVPGILPDFYPGLDTGALSAGRDRAIATLQRAADLRLTAYRFRDTVHASVRITNRTGHKLPTGYPDGRRMWINVVASDSAGGTVFESGSYNPDSALLAHDPQLKIYETVQGMTSATAATFGLQPGPSFHFFLNDTILSDDRIPPKGFTNLGFAIRRAEPVGKVYADSQYWDDTRYVLPGSAARVTATLYYQTMSREYADFLRDEDSANPYDWNAWGLKLHNSWAAHGRSSPVAMNTQSVGVVDTILGVHVGGTHPLTFTLNQNYPNPFNPVTHITFTLGHSSFVSMKVFDGAGREVRTLVSATLVAGTYDISFEGSGLASGEYLYSLTSGGSRQTKKMMLLK
ncbi:MAG TPA: T9SS type A sorting domain-containing protein [Bacteroidota bacterium]|nr:T9SS type A sorting domain-containing protein [Bacteroidota bacterium]